MVFSLPEASGTVEKEAESQTGKIALGNYNGINASGPDLVTFHFF
jgi:hypothetical protein